MHFRTALGRFRLVAFLEGCSYMVLFFVAMPLKYFAGLPLAVRIFGSLHGLLVVVFCAALVEVWYRRNWTLGRAALALGLSFLPIGTFLFDPSLKREQQSAEGPNDSPSP